MLSAALPATALGDTGEVVELHAVTLNARAAIPVALKMFVMASYSGTPGAF